jgi:pseudouridylate synthase
LNPVLHISEEVVDALGENRPVVALESAIIAHGMPPPRNLETARRLESIVRQGGGVPATIAVFDGKIHVGLPEERLEQLSVDPTVAKVSTRDLPAILASGRPGATTVASTLIGARLAGIGLVVTGGIGGVHRGGADSLDVSADLHELARNGPLAVVCSGAKAILDIGRTLEVLETLGVLVVGYGTDRFPAFYSRDSGFGLPYRVDSPEQAAGIIRTQRALGLEGAIVMANPIPPHDAMDSAKVETHIQLAIEEARERGVIGKDLTPFLLGRLAEASHGKILETNVSLVCHNADVGVAIARALTRDT